MTLLHAAHRMVPSYPPLCTFHGYITQPVVHLPTQLSGSSSLSPSPPIQNVPHFPASSAPPPRPQGPTTSSFIIIIIPYTPPPRALYYLEIAPLSPIPPPPPPPPCLLQTSQGQLWEAALAGWVSADKETEVQISSQSPLTGKSSSLD